MNTTLLLAKLRGSTNAAKRRAFAIERKKRGRERQLLALQVGTYVLNSLEHGGQMSLKNYLSVTPRWILSRYDHRRKS